MTTPQMPRSGRSLLRLLAASIVAVASPAAGIATVMSLSGAPPQGHPEPVPFADAQAPEAAQYAQKRHRSNRRPQ